MFKKLAKVAGLIGAAAAIVWAMRDRFFSIATSREPERPTFRTHKGGMSVEAVDGIGPVFAERLTAAGIEDLETLAKASPDLVAEAAAVSVARARTWIEQAAAH